MLDTVQAFLGYVLIAEDNETALLDLLTRYRKNKLNRDEFALLLDKAELKLTVKYEKVELRIRNMIFTVPRKHSGRQTGFSAHRIRAVRREIAGVIEKRYLASRQQNLTNKCEKINFFSKKTTFTLDNSAKVLYNCTQRGSVFRFSGDGRAEIGEDSEEN